MPVPPLFGAFGIHFVNTSTWNPADKGPAVVLSNGNRVLTVAGAPQSARGTLSITTGSQKLYAEVTVLLTGDTSIGVGNSSATLTSFVGRDANATGYGSPGALIFNNMPVFTWPTFGAGDIIGIATNTATHELWWSKNGVWTAGDPVAGTGSPISWPSATVFLMASDQDGGSESVNTGQQPFAHGPPTGYTAWG